MRKEKIKKNAVNLCLFSTGCMSFPTKSQPVNLIIIQLLMKNN